MNKKGVLTTVQKLILLMIMLVIAYFLMQRYYLGPSDTFEEVVKCSNIPGVDGECMKIGECKTTGGIVIGENVNGCPPEADKDKEPAEQRVICCVS